MIIVFVDEVTNLFLDHDTRRMALRMIRECRAFGMNFITLGQSWSHKEMDTSFREQHRTTGHFGTNNPHSSRMMLNSPEAINITVPGRAYFALPFGLARGIVEIQTPYLDPDTALRLLPATTTPASMPPSRSKDEESVGIGSDTAASPDGFARRVVELFDAGDTITAICKKIFGYKNQGKLDQVKQVLSEAGRIG